jgi:hypothetical protein
MRRCKCPGGSQMDENEFPKSDTSLWWYQFIKEGYTLDQWYSTFFLRVPPDIISLQLCTPKVGV